MTRTLVICEKPDAATRVARALDVNGSPSRKLMPGNVPYYECENRDGHVTVCSALGHLYSLGSKGKAQRRFYPVWDYQWMPKHLVERQSGRLRAWVSAVSFLARNADRFVSATDYDVEGALMGFQILHHACNGADKKALRMKFSTMTEKELRLAYKQMSPSLDFPLAEAGRCRHELDWLYGVNLSRFLTESLVKSSSGYATLSTGRVQGPTLRFVVEREEEISCHVPIPFWTIEASIKHNGKMYRLEYEKEKILVLSEADRVVQDCTCSVLEVTGLESHQVRENPPFPLDLSTLQSEAYGHFGYSPSRTLVIAERLYLDALISYPRTSSQKLPPDIGYESILRGISSYDGYSRLVNKLLKSSLRPNHGVKDDPAHPAIYPTGETPTRELYGQEARIYDLISRRFMATFGPPSIKENSSIILETGPHKFLLHGSVIIEPGWTEYYWPYAKADEQELPNLQKGDKASMDSVKMLEKFTEHPPRYNPSSLLQKMELENLGTKATRADIIELLYLRKYMKDLRIQPTPLAIRIVGLLRKYCPLIVDARFTARLEESMESIRQKGTSRRRVLVEALDHLRPVMLDLVSRELEVGRVLGDTVRAQRVSDVTFETPCPECGALMVIVRNRKTGKRFVGHTGPWEGVRRCSFSLPLPPYGDISLLASRCKTCGFQMVQAKSRGRKPLVSCPRCYVDKMRAKRSVGRRREPVRLQREAYQTG